MFRKLLKIVGGALLIIIAVVLFNTFTFKSKQLDITATPAPGYTPEALEHFKGAIKFKTISYNDLSRFDSVEFNGFHRYLKATYPLLHEKLSLQKLAGYALLYKWEGSDPSLLPYILMAHQDVVPIEEASRDLWTVDPFAGEVKRDTIWGRGTTDDKINLIAIMESVEKLLKENFQPSRTIYLAFGYDEEVDGRGATAIAAEFKMRKITAEMILDEGGIVTVDKVPGMTKPVALIGTSEKGYLSIELKVEMGGGHSSMPEKETALDVLTNALTTLHEHPFEARFSPPTEGFLEYVGPEMPFLQKMVFANTWLFKGIVIGIYEGSPGGNALVRTTAVPTIIQGGVKDNVIPTSVMAVVNFRMLPGDTTGLVIDRVRRLINDDRVAITKLSGSSEPTEMTPIEGPGYKLVDEVVHRTLENTITAPFMMIGYTDSRHMKEVSKNIIKFSPMTDPVGFHGIDERVSLKSYSETLWFFETLLRQTK